MGQRNEAEVGGDARDINVYRDRQTIRCAV